MAHKVFICHASSDKQVADAACAALEAQRIPCWIAPRDILAGEEYQESIVEALSDSQIVLLIFSAHANDSPQVRREIERAVTKGKIVVPFRIEDIMPSRAMEFALGNTHWLDALTPPLEHHLPELCHAISRLLEKHKEAGPPLLQPQGSVSEDSHVIPLPVTEKAPVSTGEEALPGTARSHTAAAGETMAAIVREGPPAIEEKLPTPLKGTVDRGLTKEPEQRYESTRGLYRKLRNLRGHFSGAYSSSALAPVAALKTRQRWAIPAAIGTACLLTGLLVYFLKPSGQDIGKYRYTPFASDAWLPVWSPDGKVVAYAGKVSGINQVFLRYLNSPVAVQLTHEEHSIYPLGWSSDRNHLIVVERTDRTESPRQKLYSVATVGGDLDPIMDTDCTACGLSPDGKAFATLSFPKNPGELYGVAISDPLGSPLQSYTPAPFASKELSNIPQLLFSPDGKKILLFRAGDKNKDEAWLLPYPAGSKPPQRILQKLPPYQGTPTFSWMPDSRHIVVALAAEQDAPAHLWMADTRSDDLTPLTTSNAGESRPAVAPDGRSLIYVQSTLSVDVVSVSLQDGSAGTLISSGRYEGMAAWSAKAEKLAWVTNRSGPYEIWVRSTDGAERPVVTAEQFPDGLNKWFMNPALSPDGQRLIFARIDSNSMGRLWMISLSGGAPVQLTNVEADGESCGAWSPDGSRYVYLQVESGKKSLMTVKTSGNAAPIELRKDVSFYPPDWSPAGDWITFRDEKGWNLISPDGKTTKFLGKIATNHLAFSKDGKLLYGIQTGDTEADRDRATLFSMNPVTLRQNVIKELGKDLRPGSYFTPGIRFSLAPDGKSIVYSTVKQRSDLWMLRGYR